MIRHPRYHIIGFVFCFVLMGNMDMTLSKAYALDIADNPTAYLVSKAREKKLVLIGTHHRNIYIHNVITKSLPFLIKEAGINILFVEIPTSQQQLINLFCAQKLNVDSIGISDIVTSPSFKEVLNQARSLGMTIIAIDTEVPSPVSRDEWMAKQVSSYLEEHPKGKGIVVVGARHVLKGLEWVCTDSPSLADYLKDLDTFSVVPWPDAADTNLPVAMDISTVNFGGVRMPLLSSMNVRPHVSLVSAADGIILLPKAQ